MKKLLVFGIIVLFIGMSIPSTGRDVEQSFISPLYDYNTLYVGGSGPGNYSTIQEAIDNGSSGDTIFVYKGNYSVFHAFYRLTIIGESREETIVIANEIKLTGPYVKLTNFSLIGKTAGLDNVLFVNGDNINVSYCTLTPSDTRGPTYGIEIGWCENTNIYNCDILGFDYWAITLSDCKNCYIVNCTIEGSYRGIFTLGSRPGQFYAINCELYNCGWDDFQLGASIFLCQGGRNHIINCDMHNNAKGIDIHGSEYNEIIGCNIHGNKDGIDMPAARSSDNKIILNNIHHNKEGLCIKSGNNNYIYNNNFVNNTVFNGYNDVDDLNIWDNGYPFGGNYWDDYNGTDSDGDGIGDTPYNISGGYMKDQYPLMEPYENLRSSNNGPYYGFINNSIQFNGFACGGNSPYNWFWTFGDGKTSIEQNPNHTYANIGKYNICLNVTDECGNTSSHTSWVNIQETNYPPYTPIIKGPKYGAVNNYINYKFVSEDFDENEVWFYIEWGDDQKDEWIGPFASGEKTTICHKWLKRGPFIIRAKARDGYKNESDWTTFNVTMPKCKNVWHPWWLDTFPLLHRLLEWLLG